MTAADETLGEAPAAPGSVLDRIRNRRKEILDQGAQPLDLLIPGYDDVWVRLRRLSPDELNRVVDDESVTVTNADALVAALLGIYDGPPATGTVIAERFDQLAEQIGCETGTARGDCIAVYADDYAVCDHGSQLARFSRRAYDDTEETLAGESPATTTTSSSKP